MLAAIGTPERVPAFLERVKASRERLVGFGHRVFHGTDPRVPIVKRIAREVGRGSSAAVGRSGPLTPTPRSARVPAAPT